MTAQAIGALKVIQWVQQVQTYQWLLDLQREYTSVADSRVDFVTSVFKAQNNLRAISTLTVSHA